MASRLLSNAACPMLSFVPSNYLMPVKKQLISGESGSSRTAHLQPLIDFLKAQGNPSWLAPSHRPVGSDGFYFDADEYGTFYFEQPLDLLALTAQFELPDTVIIGKTAVYDSRHFVCISQAIL